jgi:hypothetical protein
LSSHMKEKREEHRREEKKRTEAIGLSFLYLRH